MEDLLVQEEQKFALTPEEAAKKLETARTALAEIDDKIIELIAERTTHYGDIRAAKNTLNMPIFNAGVEKAKLSKIAETAENPVVERSAHAALEAVMRVSRMAQHRMNYQETVSWEPGDTVNSAPHTLPQLKVLTTQGTLESYSAKAAAFLFPEAKILPAQSFVGAAQEVATEIVPAAVLPLENSTAGSIDEVYQLIDSLGLYIIATIDVPIRHCLCAIPGTKLSDIRTIISHPQALAQCSLFIQGMNWQTKEVNNTAFGARDVAEIQSKTVAALASPTAAAANGLEIIQAQMSDVVMNTTRFAVLAAKPVIEKDADIVSLIVRLPHYSGALAGLLNILSDYGLNLLKIKSAPVPDVPWEYNFYLDLEGNFADKATLPALYELQQELTMLRFVGWYKNYQYTEE